MKNNTAQKNIPQGWQEVPIGEHIELQGGNAFRASDYVSEGIPLVRIGNVGKGYFVANDFVYVSEKEYKNNEAVHLNENDILMGMTGELGKVAKIGGKHLPAVLNQRVGRVVFKDKKLNAEFVYYIFLSDSFREKLEKYFIGAAQKNISSSQVESIEVLLPPIAEQQKIAEILGSVDEDILKTQELIDDAEKLKKGLMQELFTRGIGHKKFKKTKLGEIPESWEISDLEKISKNLDNKRIPITKSKRISGQYPYYGATGIVDYVADYIFDDKLLLISEDGANLKDRNYPIAFTASGKFWVNNHAHIQKFEDIFLQKYVEDYLNMINLEPYLTGMAQPKLNKERLFKIPIPKPIDKNEIEKITKILSAVDEKISINKKLKSKLIQLKKGLARDLLSGKVRV